MLEELEKKIQLEKEVLESLPVNNHKNMKKAREELQEKLLHYQEEKEKIYQELVKRVKPYLQLKEEDYNDLKASIEEIFKALTYTNNLSSPYEKLKIDKIVYQLTNNLENDFEVTNKLLLKVIAIFQKAGISLKAEDFNYTKYVSSYMQNFFFYQNDLENEELKKTFDDLYWKCPDILLELELNIRYLYLKNKDKFQKYLSSFNENMLSKFKKREESLIEDYSYLRKKLEDLEFHNKNNLMYQFISEKKKIEDYDDMKMDVILNKLFAVREKDSIEVIKKLLHSLLEYKNYLKYEKIVIKVKELYQQDLEKNFLNTRLKNIIKLEKQLFKLNKKEDRSNKKNKVSQYELEISNLIKEIKAIYDEIDQNMLKIIIKEHIKDNSTIFKVFLLVLQYYSFFSSFFVASHLDSSVLTEQQVIEEELKSFAQFVLDPDNNIITNVTILEQRDLANTIVENYKLFHINMTKEMLEVDNLDSFLSNLEKVITYYKIKELAIDPVLIKNIITIKSFMKKEENV